MPDDRTPFALGASGLLDPVADVALDGVTEHARSLLATSAVELTIDAPGRSIVKSRAGAGGGAAELSQAVCTVDGHVFGALRALHDTVRAWTAHDVAILEAWAATAAAAIELHLSRFMAERAVSLAQSQSTVLRHIAEGRELHRTLEDIVDHVQRHATETVGSVLLLSPDGRHLHHGAGASLPQPYREAIDGIEIGDGVGSCGTAAYLGELVVVSDIEHDPRWADFKALALALAHGLRACSSKPIQTAEEQVLGTFAFYYRDVRRPTEEELTLIGDAAAMAGIAIERERTQRALVEGATRDPLTGLWNRRVMLEQLNRRREPTEELAVVYFVDVDHFKEVNDRLGHQAGDELLQAVARRLERITREGDVLTRLGGDELALFARGVGSRAEAEAFAERLLRALELPFELSMAAVEVKVSVGVAIADPETDGEALLGAADRAMYRVKSSGGDGFAVLEDRRDDAG